MIIYFIAFFISFGFSFFAEKANSKNKKKLFLLLSGFAILFPSIMAGLRMSGVGTDTKVYIDWVFRESVYMDNIGDLLKFVSTSGVEFLYCFTNFIVSRFSNSLTTIYFVLELIIILITYIAIIKVSKKMNLNYSYCYLVYLILFFNKSLNLCRQSIAMAICLLSIVYILDRKLIKFIISMLIGYGFHKSILIFAPVYFLYSYPKSKKSSNILLRVITIFILFFTVIMFKNIVILLTGTGILSSKYLNYVYTYGTGNNIKFIEIAFEIVILVLGILFRKNLIKRHETNDFLIFIIIISFITFLFGYNASYSQRISYYYCLIVIFIIPQLSSLIKVKKEQSIFNCFIILCLLTYSYLYYEKFLFDQTVPYQIDISSTKYIGGK